MRRALAALALCSLACDPTRPADPIVRIDEFTSVHSVLLAGSREVHVLITRVSIPFIENEAAVPVSGANVSLGAEGWTWPLEAANDLDRCTADEQRLSLAAGCYVATLEQEIRPGATYTLDIVLPDGDVVTGSTTVPPPPEIVSPSAKPTFESIWNGTTYEERTPITLRWEDTSPDALFAITAGVDRPGCTVNILSDDPFSSFGLPLHEVLGRDSVQLRVHTVQCEPEIAAATFDGFVRVTRYGDELARYRRASPNGHGRLNGLSFGITGAIGVFTGASSVVLPATIIQH